MIKNTVWILLGLAILSGCRSNIADDVISTINRNCTNRTELKCTIVLKDITRFKWNKLYFFGSWTVSDSIKNKIGVNYDGEDVPDDYRRMLFTYNDKVVYEEDFKPFDYGRPTVNFSVTIDSLLQAKVPYFTPSNAMFTVTKNKIEEGCDKCFEYNLIPIKK